MYQRRFDRQLRAHLRTLITRRRSLRNTAQARSASTRTIWNACSNYFPPAGPSRANTCCFELEANRKYKIVDHHGAGGAACPGDVDGTVYTDKNEALHAVFLMRVDALMGERRPEGREKRAMAEIHLAGYCDRFSARPGASGSTSW